MVLSAAQIGDVRAGKLREARFPIDDPPECEIGDVVRLKRAANPPRLSSVFVKVKDWYPTDPPLEEWVVEFERVPEPHPARLLAPITARRFDRGYTDVPELAFIGGPDPGEAVDDEWLERFVKDGALGFYRHRVRTARERHQERSRLSIDERIERARAAARERHLDVRSEIRELKRMIAKGQPHDVVLGQLKRIERIAHREAV